MKICILRGDCIQSFWMADTAVHHHNGAQDLMVKGLGLETE